MICLNCGRENENGMSFCVYCGTRLEGAPVEPIPAGQSFCTNCGAVLEAGSAFCIMCGAQQAPVSESVPEYTPEPIPVPREIKLTPDRSAANPEMYHPRPVEKPKPLHSAFMSASDLPVRGETPAARPAEAAPVYIPEPVAVPVVQTPAPTYVVPETVPVAEAPAPTYVVPEEAPAVEAPTPTYAPEAAPVVKVPAYEPVPAAPAFDWRPEPVMAKPEEEMLYCIHCGERIPATCRNCTACGAAQGGEDLFEPTIPPVADNLFEPTLPPMAEVPVAAAPEEEMVFCTSCGAKIPASYSFCTACGAKQELL